MITLWRGNPLIYEINTWTWLYGLSQTYGHFITLGNVPETELDKLAAWGLDAIWLMGIWERSPAGREIARTHPGLQNEYRRALPDFTPEKVVGSPYSIHGYEVEPHLGGQDELAQFRLRLAERGLRLILDYVPNHVAHDHPWLETNPECFIHGTPNDFALQPDHFFERPGSERPVVFANGRDPYFPAWTDTAQLNAFSPIMREKSIQTLLDIASQCDGVRCDMAMLVTNRVFMQTWGKRAGEPPDREYWGEVIPAIKEKHPHFLFISEVYWDMEWELQQQGFDYTYDKHLLDRLKNETPRAINAHLRADLDYQNKLVRMTENHDETRAIQALGPGRHQAAAILVATLPGSTLFHEGQFAGHKIKLPVQLGCRPYEADDPDTEAFYRVLLAEVTKPIYHEGGWHLREVAPAWDLNASHTSLIAFTWQHDEERRLIVVNYAPTASQGRIGLADFGLAPRSWILTDVLAGTSYERDGGEMSEYGLYIDLKPWQSHIFEFE
jgi:hypothetical protein